MHEILGNIAVNSDDLHCSILSPGRAIWVTMSTNVHGDVFPVITRLKILSKLLVVFFSQGYLSSWGTCRHGLLSRA